MRVFCDELLQSPQRGLPYRTLTSACVQYQRTHSKANMLGSRYRQSFTIKRHHSNTEGFTILPHGTSCAPQKYLTTHTAGDVMSTSSSTQIGRSMEPCNSIIVFPSPTYVIKTATLEHLLGDVYIHIATSLSFRHVDACSHQRVALMSGDATPI